MTLTKSILYWSPVFAWLLTGCALFSRGNDAIKLTGVQPDREQCRFIAQAVGRGGGDVIPLASGKLSVREDAADHIRDIAELRGGNLVYVVESQNDDLSDDFEEIGTIIGEVYYCR